MVGKLCENKVQILQYEQKISFWAEMVEWEISIKKAGWNLNWLTLAEHNIQKCSTRLNMN